MPRPRRLPQQLVQRLSVVPAPTRGLNTVGDWAQMAPTDAVECDNMIASDLGLTVRNGWREYATNINGGAAVKTVLSYASAPGSGTTPPLATSTLFAATDNGIWNIEGGGDMTGKPRALVLSGATDAGVLHAVQFTDGGGNQLLIACSETDGAMVYDGLTWKKFATSGPAGPGVISGTDPANFVHVVVWKHRLLFTRRSSGQIWFLDTYASGGVALSFDFGSTLLHGGMLLGLANWTMDAGDGIDDRLVTIGSSGDIAIYAGPSPISASFGLVGTWFIGQPPVGRRCWTTTGGNVYILTQFGVVPIAELMQGGLDTILTADTDLLTQLRKLQGQLNVDFTTLLNTPGWELVSLPNLALLVIARPGSSVTDNIQYAFQQHSMSWSRLLDIPVYTISRRLNEVFGGTQDGRVLKLFEGYTDGAKRDGTGEYEIRARVTPAFSYFDNPGVRKRALMIRLQWMAKANPGWSVRMNSDFEINPALGTQGSRANTGSLWDSGLWNVAVWSGGQQAFGEWRQVTALGYALAPSIFISCMQSTTLASLTICTDSGGPL